MLRWFIAIVAGLLAGCGGGDAPSNASPKAPPGAGKPPILKIAVFQDGRITADGSPTTLPELRASLKAHAERQGVVWYYREAGQGEPPAVAADVVKAVIDARLPIRLSSKPDYSDAIGPDGKPINAK